MIKMRLSSASACHFIQANGYGTITYTALVHGLESVDVVIAYYHDQQHQGGGEDGVEEVETMGMSAVVYFNPNGSVKLKEVLLQLDRQPVKLHFPLDIVEEKFIRSRATAGNGDIFNGLDMTDLYGKSVDFLEKKNSNNSPNQLRQAIFERNHGLRRPRPDKEDDDQHHQQQQHRHFKVPRLEDMPSFMEQKRAAEKRDEALAVELKRRWLLPLKRVLRTMFNDCQRARELLRMWHSSAPPKPTVMVPDSSTLYANFMRNLLTCRLELVISDSYVSVFNHQMFIIPLGSLKKDEQVFFESLVVNRKELFKQIDQGIDGRSFRLDKFRLNDVVATVVCPRFFVQQLVIDCIQIGIRSGVAELFITVCSAVAKCWAKNKRDVFLSHLMGAIESSRDYDLEDIQVLGMFVPIAGSRPVYELVNMTEEERAIAKAIEKARETGLPLPSAVPLRTPTPYRLV